MTQDDLAFIFRPQLDDGEKLVYYMLIDHGHELIEQQPVDKLNELLPMLCHFRFDGYNPEKMPRFICG